MQGITLERWREAQEAERSLHNADKNNNHNHYKNTYENYFRLLELGFNLHGLSVTEIGPADYPALRYCENYTHSVIIEPMPSKELEVFCDGKISLITEPLELINTLPATTEVWLFNVMQHIIDPDIFISKCKEIGKRIRFFEPINYPTSVHHPHQFTVDDFRKWFGDCTKLYKGGALPGFHESDCAYGVFINQ